jgi:hypothetical protein
MKKLLYLAAVLALCGLAKASSIYCSLEICKQNAWSVEEGEQLRRLMPTKYNDWLNNYIVAVKQGMTESYIAAIWLEQADDPIKSAYVVKPDTSTVTLYPDGGGVFTSGINRVTDFYVSPSDLNAHWPSGDYVLHVTFKDGHEQTWTTTVPDYGTTPFPDIVNGSLSAGAGGLLSLDWSTVAGISEYDIWTTDMKKLKNVFNIVGFNATPPQSLTTTLTGTYAGKGDYMATVQADNEIASGDFAVSFDTQARWLSFKKPATPIENTISKFTVKPGKPGASKDSLSFTGLLNAIAADLIIAEGNNIVVDINSVDMPSPLEFQFPINATTFKKGVYSGTGPEKNSSFKFDTKNGKMTFNAKGLDLTGLTYPITLTITIGDYEANFTVD